MPNYHFFVKDKLLYHPMGENLQGAIEYIEEVAPFIQKIVKEKSINIWCRGSSGAILGALLAKTIPNPCNICHVKKKGEDSHQNNIEHIFCGECKNILLDDFSRSGKTLDAIYEAYKEKLGEEQVLDILVLANGWKDCPPRFPVKHIIIDADTGREWKKIK